MPMKPLTRFQKFFFLIWIPCIITGNIFLIKESGFTISIWYQIILALSTLIFSYASWIDRNLTRFLINVSLCLTISTSILIYYI